MNTVPSFSQVSVKESLRRRLAEAREQYLSAGGVESRIPSHVFGENFASPKPHSEALRKINTVEAAAARIRKERAQ